MKLLLIVFYLVEVTQLNSQVNYLWSDDDYFVVYESSLGRTANQPILVFGVRGNGTVVWSDETADGERLYYSAKISTQKVRQFFEQLSKIGVFEDETLSVGDFGPDSSFTTIQIQHKEKKLRMQSWHENCEIVPQKVATEKGVRSLEDDENLLKALKNESANYLYYRMVWLELRLAAAKLVPRGNKQVDVDFKFDELGLDWKIKAKDIAGGAGVPGQ